MYTRFRSGVLVHRECSIDDDSTRSGHVDQAQWKQSNGQPVILYHTGYGIIVVHVEHIFTAYGGPATSTPKWLK